MITRAQIRRQLRKNGGIMNVTPRQGYFLGKIVKAVTKPIKKVVDVGKQVIKSPIGKAAILGLGGAGLMGMGPLSGLSGIGSRIGGGLAGLKGSLFGLPGVANVPDAIGGGYTKGILGKLGLTKGGGSLMPTVLGGLSAAGLTTYFMQKGKTEEEAEQLMQDVKRGEGLGLDIIKEDIKKYRSGILSGSQMFDKGYNFLLPREYIGAKGGRVGLANGSEGVKQMYVSDEAGALPKKMKDGEGGVLPSDMGKLKRNDFESEADYKRYLRRLNKKAQGGRIGYQQGTPAVDPRMNKSLQENTITNQIQREISNAVRSNKWDEYLQSQATAGGGSPGGYQSYQSLYPAASKKHDYQGLGNFVGTHKAMSEDLIDMLTRQRMGQQQPRKEILTPALKAYDETNTLIGSGQGPIGIDPLTDPVRHITSAAEANKLAELMAPGSTQSYIKPTFEQRMGGESWDMLSTGDQERIASEYPEMNLQVRGMAQGGRVGFASGTDYYKGALRKKGYKDSYFKGMSGKDIRDLYDSVMGTFSLRRAQGGRISKYGGGVMSAMPRIPMGMPRVNAGGVTELDYRQEGGFVPVGVKEKADDVPAMLSKNEFVMTADAVKGAGGGNVEKGAQRMYDTMKSLEKRIA